MKKNTFFSLAVMAMALLINAGCSNNTTAKEETSVKDTSAISMPSVTNPNFIIAPMEYVTLSERAFSLMTALNFDAWGDMLADNVVYSFPDGDVETRTKLEGRAAVVGWWKTWKEKAGVQSMTMTEFNHFPLNVTAQPKGGAPTGIYDFVYFSNKIFFGDKAVSLRMNFVLHFNADKKIDRYVTYYDRSVIIKATGKNILEETKAGK